MIRKQSHFFSLKKLTYPMHDDAWNQKLSSGAGGGGGGFGVQAQLAEKNSDVFVCLFV